MLLRPGLVEDFERAGDGVVQGGGWVVGCVFVEVGLEAAAEGCFGDPAWLSEGASARWVREMGWESVKERARKRRKAK